MTAPRQTTALLLAALLTPGGIAAASDAEIAELHALIATLKSDYDRRIQELEQRLAAAEREAALQARRSRTATTTAATAGATAATAAAVQPADRQPMAAPSTLAANAAPASSGWGVLTSGNAFNPQISVILDGNYYSDDRDGAGAALVGQALRADSGDAAHDHADDHAEDAHGHSHGGLDNGFNFREAELSFAATVDPYFDAATYLAIQGDGTVHLEEAWLQTRGLPAGLRAKAGKFQSDFGYINRQHPHQWDFVDQNLPYLNLLGDHGIQDSGVQLTWLPDLPIYTLVGAEALQGDQEVFGATLDAEEQADLDLGDTRDGPRLWTLFAKVAPDLGVNQALQLGASFAHATQHQAVQHHSHAHEEETHEAEATAGEAEIHTNGLAGDAALWGIDLVYTFDGAGPQGQGDFRLQSEYLRSIKDLEIRSSPHAELIGSPREFTTDGLYAQALYGIAPKWTLGLRYDVLGLTNRVDGGSNDSFGSSDRWTLNLTWSPTEFSQIRAQYARSDILGADAERETFDAFYLQFLVSLGSHGAHSF